MRSLWKPVLWFLIAPLMIFAPGGHVAETLCYARDGQTQSAHGWFDRRLPVKPDRGGKTYGTRGDRFGRIDGDCFVDTPRGPYSE